MFQIEIGTEAVLILPSGVKTKFYTRRSLRFSPRERIKSEPGKLAFKRKNHTLIVSTGDVSVPLRVEKAVTSGLVSIQPYVGRDDTVKSLLAAKNLNVAQLILAAVLIKKYKRFLLNEIYREAVSIL